MMQCKQGNDRRMAVAPAATNGVFKVHNGLLPVIEVMLDGKVVRALVDTGCSTAVVRSRLINKCKGESRMTAFDGREVKCKGVCWIDLVVVGKTESSCCGD